MSEKLFRGGELSSKRKLYIALMVAIAVIGACAIATQFGEDDADSKKKFTAGDLKYEVISKGAVKVVGYAGEPMQVDIPSFVEFENYTYVVEVIGESAFEGSHITSVKLSDKVNTVDRYAFKNCESLTSVTLGSITDLIRNDAFYNCKSLVNLDLKNVQKIEEEAFTKCISLETLVIPDTIDKLGYFVFSDCSGLKKLTIPITFNFESESYCPVFKKCENIEVITMTKGTDGDGHDYNNKNKHKYSPMFISKGSLKTVIIEEGVVEIGNNTFDGCDAIETLVLPDTLESIGKDAFKGYRFFDSDGITQLSIDAEHLKGCTFSGSNGALVKK